MRLHGLAFAVLLSLPAGFVSIARAEDLVDLAAGSVDMSKDGSITFDVTKARGGYRAIRIRNAGKAAIDVATVKVVYEDGSSHLEDRQIDMRPGERSREIDPASNPRLVDSVVVTWKATKGTTQLKVVGIQTPAGRKMARTRGAPSAPAAQSPGAPATPPQPVTTAGEKFTDDGILFGHQTISLDGGSGTIGVGSEIGKFERIRLRVLGNDIGLDTAKVTYADGSSQDLAVNAALKANTQTGWLAVDGTKFIRDITFSYRAKPDAKGQARVEVMGEYAKGWLGASGEGAKHNDGWVLLGAQTAGFTGYDKDTIPVSANEGGFTRLRVISKDRAITLREVRVVFLSGPDEVFQMRERVDPGKPFGPLEFKGGRAAIKEIKARYRSRFDLAKGLKNLFEGTPAVVEIWGQQ